MINAHPMVKGSFYSNPNSVRVRAPQQFNAAYAASETVIDRRAATKGSARLAIALHRAFITKSPDDSQDHLDCIAIHEATIERIEAEEA